MPNIFIVLIVIFTAAVLIWVLRPIGPKLTKSSSKEYTLHPSMQDVKVKPMRIRISDIDYAPEDLYGQTPFEADIVRYIPGSDRPDYWLAELARPIDWNQNGQQKEISHIILATRYVGDQMTRGIKQRPVSLAYVTDKSLLTDERLTFHKCAYVAIGTIDDISHTKS
jgi:hypothetical protein